MSIISIIKYDYNRNDSSHNVFRFIINQTHIIHWCAICNHQYSTIMLKTFWIECNNIKCLQETLQTIVLTINEWFTNVMQSNTIVQHRISLVKTSCQTMSSRSFVEHLLQSDSSCCTVDTTRFKNNGKSDPILSDLGTLAINSVHTLCSVP